MTNALNNINTNFNFSNKAFDNSAEEHNTLLKNKILENNLTKIAHNERLRVSLQSQLTEIKNIVPDSYKEIILNSCDVDLKSENNKRTFNDDAKKHESIISRLQQALKGIYNNNGIKKSTIKNKPLLNRDVNNLNDKFAPEKKLLANEAPKNDTLFNISTQLEYASLCLDHVIKKRESLQYNINELIKLEQSLTAAKKLSNNEDEITKLTLDKERVLYNIVNNCQQIISDSIKLNVYFDEILFLTQEFSKINNPEEKDLF